MMLMAMSILLQTTPTLYLSMAWTTSYLMRLPDHDQIEVESILENEGEMMKTPDHVPLEAITNDVEMTLSCRPGRVLDMALPPPGSLHSGPRMCLLQRSYYQSCVGAC